MKSSRLYPSWLRTLLIIAIGVGVFFHWVNLDRKVYWHDEVYTTMRAGGWTRGEIDQSLFQNRFVTVDEMQAFQQVKPNSTGIATVNSLAVEDPQHPPLYFLLSRLWLHWFGNSLTASRSLAVLLSLVGLPLMYKLAMELFAARPVALLATVLLALSPYDILFAQTNRQYSLLTTIVIGTSWSLLQALRRPNGWNWGLYAFGVAMGFYTHPFFALTLAAHGIYVLLSPVPAAIDRSKKAGRSPVVSLLAPPKQYGVPVPKTPNYQRLKVYAQFLLAVLGAIVLYLPWLLILVNNQQRALATTDWARFATPFIYLVKLWILSFTALFFDLDFGFNNVWTFTLRLPFVLLILAGLYVVYRRTVRSTWLFIFTSLFVPFVLLLLPDLVLGGKRSAVSRYLVSCYPAIQLAVAYLLGLGLAGGRWFWRIVLAIVLTLSVVSVGASAKADTWWSKDLSYSNAEVARLIEAAAEPSPVVVVSDIGDDYTNTGDLMSLSYRLNHPLGDRVRFFTVSQPPNLQPLQNEANVLVFRPSDKLAKLIVQQGGRLENVSQPGRLWRFYRT